MHSTFTPLNSKIVPTTNFTLLISNNSCVAISLTMLELSRTPVTSPFLSMTQGTTSITFSQQVANPTILHNREVLSFFKYPPNFTLSPALRLDIVLSELLITLFSKVYNCITAKGEYS